MRHSEKPKCLPRQVFPSVFAALELETVGDGLPPSEGNVITCEYDSQKGSGRQGECRALSSSLPPSTDDATWAPIIL